jgi:peptidoglycan/LPS O-acetylase OafA/YrhL
MAVDLRPKYRPDIDGLRAIAVLSVVVFHAFPTLLQGGFVGVDVFFVISGYLITSIILSGVETGTLKLRDFYAKRINRIFPALILVLASVYTFGWIALLPEEYEKLSKHIVGGVLFVSNFVLLRESGYFDVDAATKPLLHLWSLAIEEQFYIIWPPLLIATLRFTRKLVPILLVVLIAVSFTCNVAAISTEPKVAFYFPFSRAWELMAGGLLAHATLRWHALPTSFVQPQSVLGLVLLSAGIVLTGKDAAFPGYWALLPVLGSFFLISAGPGGLVNRFLLANRPMVFVGKISYPLYLWHWPLLSYARILEQETPGIAVRATAVALAVLLACLTYLAIERPMRSRKFLRWKAAVAVAVMLMLAIVSAVTMQKRGLPDRAGLAGVAIPAPWRAALAASASACPIAIGAYKDCYLFDGKGDEDVLLLGDSHAGHLVPGIAAAKPRDFKIGAMILNGGCPPLLGLDRLLTSHPTPVTNYGKNSASCAEINKARLSYAIRSSAKVVMLSMITPRYRIPDKPGEFYYSFDGKPGPSLLIFAKGLRRTVDRLIAAGKVVILVEDNPSFRGYNVEKCLVERPFGLVSPPVVCIRSETLVVKDNLRVAQLYQAAQLRNPDRVKVFRSRPILCPSHMCSMTINGIPMYHDAGHLSAEGSELVMRSFFPPLIAARSRSFAPASPPPG